MKILITGGVGFIGSAIIRQNIQNYHESVVNVDSPIDAPAAFIETNIVGAYTFLEPARSYLRTI